MDPEEERKVRQLLDVSGPTAESVCEEIKGYVQQVCGRLSRDDFRFRLTEARIKEPARVIRKLDRSGARADRLYDLVTDLIGLRVVVYNRSDVEAFKKAIAEDPNCPLADLQHEDVNRKSGYRALHINAWVGSPQRMGCEIQVRTALQDAWAVTSRADLYEWENDVDPLLTDLAQAQSEIVGAVDTVLQRIRDVRERSRQHVDAEKITAAEDEEAQRPSRPATPGLHHARMQEAMAALDPGERYVLDHPISEQRVEELRSGITGLRRQSSLRRLLDAAGAYQRLLEYRTECRFGNRMLAWKGPLVEGSSWIAFSPDDFHRSLETFTHIQLCDRLREDSPPQATLTLWKEVPAFAAKGIHELVANGGHPDLIVVTGIAGPGLYEMVDWRQRPPPSIGKTEVGDVPGIIGTVADLPVFRLWVHQGGPVCVYVLDLGRSFRYTQTNPDAMTDDDLYLRVETVTFEKGVELLEKNPELLQPREGPRLTREEQVVRLQLQVVLHVIEGGRIESVQPAFAIGALVEMGPEGGT